MLSSIHPLGERTKGNRFATTATAFVAGAALGGLGTGAVAGGLGSLAPDVDPEAGVLVLSGAAALGALAEWRGVGLPSLRRQVDEEWLHRYRGWVYGAGFGLQLGAGVLTYVTTAAVFVTLLAAVLVGASAGPAWSVVVFGAFGLLRGLSVLAARRVHTPDALAALHRALAASAGSVRAVSSVALLTAGFVSALAVAAGS